MINDKKIEPPPKIDQQKSSTSHFFQPKKNPKIEKKYLKTPTPNSEPVNKSEEIRNWKNVKAKTDIQLAVSVIDT